MLSEDEKAKLTNRLRRISGQVAAANGALGKVKQILLESHIKSGLVKTLQGNDKENQSRRIDELISLLQKFGRFG